VLESTPDISRFEQSLQAEHAAERDLLKSLLKSILLTLPLSIAVFVFIAAVAISDKTEWYVWLGLGVGHRRRRRAPHGVARRCDAQRAQAGRGRFARRSPDRLAYGATRSSRTCVTAA